jgi:hypothetical protein
MVAHRTLKHGHVHVSQHGHINIASERFFVHSNNPRISTLLSISRDNNPVDYNIQRRKVESPALNDMKIDSLAREIWVYFRRGIVQWVQTQHV